MLTPSGATWWWRGMMTSGIRCSWDFASGLVEWMARYGLAGMASDSVRRNHQGCGHQCGRAKVQSLGFAARNAGGLLLEPVAQ